MSDLPVFKVQRFMPLVMAPLRMQAHFRALDVDDDDVHWSAPFYSAMLGYCDFLGHDEVLKAIVDHHSRMLMQEMLYGRDT